MPKKPILKYMLILGIATVLAKFAGFAREIVLAAVYGTGIVSDALILSLSIPDTLLLFVGDSVAVCFIVMYHRVSDKTRFTHNIMTWLLLIGLAFSVVFTMIPGVLVRFFAFQIDPETFALAEYFVRYMVWSAVFMLLSDVLNAILEIKGSFFISGIRSIWRSVAVIFGIILGSLYGYNLIIALSPVAGGAISIIMLSLSCRKQGYTFRPYLNIRSPDIKQMLILIGPVLLSNTSTQIKTVISRNFAASLPVGTISALNYSNKVAVLFSVLIGQVLFTVLYPHMSSLAANGDSAELKNTLTRGVMYTTAIMLPLSIALVILAQPGVRILFQRGSFTAEDTILTAACLRMYALVVLTGGMNPLLIRAFYAIQSTKMPAIISIATVAASVLLNFLFIDLLGAEGLALAGSLSGLLTTLLLLFFLSKKMGRIGLWNNFPELVKIALATGIMGAAMWLAANVLPLMDVSIWQSALLCAALAAVAALVYAVLMILFKSNIAFGVICTIKKLFEQKRNRTV